MVSHKNKPQCMIVQQCLPFLILINFLFIYLLLFLPFFIVIDKRFFGFFFYFMIIVLVSNKIQVEQVNKWSDGIFFLDIIYVAFHSSTCAIILKFFYKKQYTLWNVKEIKFLYIFFYFFTHKGKGV